MSSCAVDNCNRRREAKGWCFKHYYRWKKNGDPNKIKIRMSPPGAGVSKEREYWIYHRMLQRCYDKNDSGYRWYGEKGVSVCERWLRDYRNFVEDVGRRPSPEHSIDRIDPNGNYEPGNVRWANPVEQANNRNRRTDSPKRGLGIYKKGNTFCVSRMFRGETYFLGAYKHLADAKAASDDFTSLVSETLSKYRETGVMPEFSPKVKPNTRRMLCREDVLDIRRFASSGMTAGEITRAYPVKERQIRNIINRKKWAGVK